MQFFSIHVASPASFFQCADRSICSRPLMQGTLRAMYAPL